MLNWQHWLGQCNVVVVIAIRFVSVVSWAAVINLMNNYEIFVHVFIRYICICILTFAYCLSALLPASITHSFALDAIFAFLSIKKPNSKAWETTRQMSNYSYTHKYIFIYICTHTPWNNYWTSQIENLTSVFTLRCTRRNFYSNSSHTPRNRAKFVVV